MSNYSDENIYLINSLRTYNYKFERDDSNLIGEILRISSEIESLNEVSSFAENIINALSSHLYFSKISRVCLVHICEYSNQLSVVSSKSKLEYGMEDYMSTGYSCFVSNNSSLFNLKRGDIRIYSDIDKVISSYEKSGKKVQRSIGYLNEMGFKSGLCMSIFIGHQMRGLLFFNSKDKDAFNNIRNENYGVLLLIKLVAKQILNFKLFTSTKLIKSFIDQSRLIEENLRNETFTFNKKHFKEYLENYLSRFIFKNIKVNLISELSNFLYSPLRIAVLIGIYESFNMLNDNSKLDLIVEKVETKVVFKFKHDIRILDSNTKVNLNKFRDEIDSFATLAGVEFEIDDTYCYYKSNLDLARNSEEVYSIYSDEN